MMNRTYEPSTPKWLKWTLLIVCLLILLSLSYVAYLYIHIQQQKTKGFANAEQRVLTETDIVHIDQIKRFHSEKMYHIIFGSNQQGMDKVAYIPVAQDEEIIVINKSDMITKETVYQRWLKSCDNCNFIQITPAIISDNLLWEITYIDDAEKYTFDYVSIYDGTLYEQLQLQQMFK